MKQVSLLVLLIMADTMEPIKSVLNLNLKYNVNLQELKVYRHKYLFVMLLSSNN